MMAPRAPTPGARSDSRATTRLPEDLVSDQVRRLGLYFGVAAALWTNGLLMDVVLVPLAIGAFHLSVPDMAVELIAISGNIATFWYMRFTERPLQTKVDAGLIGMIVNAALIAILNTSSQQSLTMLHAPSWITVVILVFSMLVPTTPRKMLVAASMAASMDPLAVWVGSLRGLQVPSAAMVMIASIPNYACALISILPARLLQRVGRQLREAQELGSYQLIERLGEGGMGEVWRAEHQLLARPAAIKLVKPEVLGAANQAEADVVLRRFEREARATAALSSPHTISIFDFGRTNDGAFYYVMELLSGRDLESLVKEFGPVSADRAIFLLRQVCHSLADAHARGLVHRDIKPANIYVCRMGLEYDFVKVLDFGLVKSFDRRAKFLATMTSPHATTGTPAYMAPEVILGEADVDQRADVYSLGCVAYYLLTGSLVFDADTPMKMLMQHVQGKPVPPSARTELPIPTDLDSLVLSCLEKDPSKRPQDARELLSALWHCNSCEGWTQERARQWWAEHLVGLTGPLTVGDRSGLEAH
jgi:serine/threonine-protein kinase